jgi:hypothetical protein
MDATYTMIGVDGLQYGPITLDQLKSWIGEGRVTAQTKILRSDTNSWLPADNYSELGLTPAPVAPVEIVGATPAPLPRTLAYDPMLERHVRSGARWFFWIAGLSLVNTLMSRSEKGYAFLIGLGVTQVIDYMGVQMGNPNIALVVNVVVSGVFALLGYFAWQRQSWSFIVGMIFYALDALVFLPGANWLGLGFHAFVLFWMFRGLKANMQLKAQLR